MPSRERVAEFVAMVEAGQFVEAIERFYAEEAVAFENQGPPTTGRAALVAKEQAALARSDIRTRKGSVALVDGDRVAIAWVFEITPGKGGGEVLTMDEIAWQRWDGDRIVEERFYYDPGQMKPPAS